MKTSVLPWTLLLAGCFGSIPPPPPCAEPPSTDGVVTEVRVQRSMSRRPTQVWSVARDSSGNWVRHGILRRYFLNGQAKSEEHWKMGALDGLARYWHANGELQGEASFAQGRLDGPATSWYDDGHMESKKYWKMGCLVGNEQRWDRKGMLISTIPWTKDSLPDSTTRVP